MKYKVYACAFKKYSLEPCRQPDGSQVRVEEIDTKTNSLFARCRNSHDVLAAYERFWNDLNNAATETVRVVGVERVSK